MHITNKPTLTDNELARLLQAQELDEIEVKNCAAVGNRTLRLLAEKYPSLKSLRWVGNGPATEEGYRAVVGLPALRILNVSGNRGFTTQLCQELLLKSTSLRMLDISFCDITDEAFEGQTCHSPLEFVNLQGCCHITDRTLRSLAKVPTLRHLVLGFNDKLTAQGLEAFAGTPVHIHQARISGM